MVSLTWEILHHLTSVVVYVETFLENGEAIVPIKNEINKL